MTCITVIYGIWRILDNYILKLWFRWVSQILIFRGTTSRVKCGELIDTYEGWLQVELSYPCGSVAGIPP